MSQENNFIPTLDSYKRITPFKLFVKSNFPFIEATYEALDNYGLYCKIVEYLNNVIANENTVEDNVAALYNAFVQLNTYVSDYFDNLDVQEEINNKLDDMVEQGILQEIIADYLNSKAIFGFDTVAEMKNATNLINGSYAKTLGYYTKNDGGKALYKIRTVTNDDVIDNMFIIGMNDEQNSLVAELIAFDEYNIKQLGANATDDIAPILQAIINKGIPAIIKIPTGTYKCSTVNVPYTSGGITIEGVSSTYKAGDFSKASNIIALSSTLFSVGHNPDTTTYTNYNFGFKVKNISINGDRNINNICFDIYKASNVELDNVVIRYFAQHGIKLNDVFDSLFNNIEIYFCGTADTYSAIYLTGTYDATNACRFTNCRIENNPYALNIGRRTQQNVFDNCKFEEGAVFLENNGTYYINITWLKDTTFNNCIFTGTYQKYLMHIDLTDGGTLPYEYPSGNINNCRFVTPGWAATGGKYLYIEKGQGLNVNSCTFYSMNIEESIKADMTIFTGCTFHMGINSSSDVVNGPLTLNNRCVVTGCNIYAATHSTGQFFNVTGQNNKIKNNQYQTTMTTSTFINSANTSNEYEPLFEYTPYVTTDTLDAFTAKTVTLAGGSMEITQVAHGYNGARIKCFCNGAVIVTKSANFCPNLPAASVTFNGNKSFELYFIYDKWLIDYAPLS